MTLARTVARLITVVTAATSAVLAVVPATSAAPPAPVVAVRIDSWSGRWVTVCGEGDVNDGATTIARWVFTVSGGVSDAAPVGPYVQIEDGDTYSYCHTVYAGSPPDAAFAVTLTFTGLRTDTGLLTTDVAGAAALVYEWNSALHQGNEIGVGSDG